MRKVGKTPHCKKRQIRASVFATFWLWSDYLSPQRTTYDETIFKQNWKEEDIAKDRFGRPVRTRATLKASLRSGSLSPFRVYWSWFTVNVNGVGSTSMSVQCQDSANDRIGRPVRSRATLKASLRAGSLWPKQSKSAKVCRSAKEMSNFGIPPNILKSTAQNFMRFTDQLDTWTSYTHNAKFTCDSNHA